jgi:hypothetical protein
MLVYGSVIVIILGLFLYGLYINYKETKDDTNKKRHYRD